MSAQSTLARGRAAAEALMVDTCTVTRETGRTTDPVTGVVTPATSTVYTGKCKLAQAGGGGAQAGGGSSSSVGNAAPTVVSYELHLPITAAEVRPGDWVSVTSTLDPQLDGRRWVVAGHMGKTYATARRLPIQEVV
ncbi:MAG TPA: DUF6093 family protein [Rugosimonospora sp.]|nr:DUF6093 family protein [Rugosimonospora sp.]